MTCFDTPTLEDSHFVSMLTFLLGVSVHPLYLTRRPVAFEEQFSGITPFPQNTVVSLDFPSVTSVAATRFFDKCYATAALGRGSLSKRVLRPPAAHGDSSGGLGTRPLKLPCGPVLRLHNICRRTVSPPRM